MQEKSWPCGTISFIGLRQPLYPKFFDQLNDRCFTCFGLGIDSGEKDIMNFKPRKSGALIMERGAWFCIIAGIFMHDSFVFSFI